MHPWSGEQVDEGGPAPVQVPLLPGGAAGRRRGRRRRGPGPLRPLPQKGALLPCPTFPPSLPSADRDRDPGHPFAVSDAAVLPLGLDDAPDSLLQEARLTGFPFPSSSLHQPHPSSPRLNDDMLAYLFAVQEGLCNKRFQLQVKVAALTYSSFLLLPGAMVEDVKFVAVPMKCPPPPLKAPASALGRDAGADADNNDILLFSIVIALRVSTSIRVPWLQTGPKGGRPQAGAGRDVVSLYQDLSERLAIAVRFEQSRVGYLNEQAGEMIALLEEFAALPEAESLSRPPVPLEEQRCVEGHGKSPYEWIENRCELAQLLRMVFNE